VTVAAIGMVKDEVDIITSSIAKMAGEVDFLIVSDNGSSDGTREALEQLTGDVPLTVVDDPEVAYYQAAKMTQLARVAARQGADWVVPFDADERWYSPFGRVADVLVDRAEAIVPATLYNHVPTVVDRDEPDPFLRMGWRCREPGALPKVACRTAVPVQVHQGNHHASYDTTTAEAGVLVIRHFPYRTPAQFESKVRNGAAAYAATDLPTHEGEHWRQFGRTLDNGGPVALAAEYRARFLIDDPEADPDLIWDPAS
jgi:hypothetical protein